MKGQGAAPQLPVESPVRTEAPIGVLNLVLMVLQLRTHLHSQSAKRSDLGRQIQI